MRKFDPGIGVKINKNDMDFIYGKDVFGPPPEKRALDSIRKSLKDPSCTGPEIVYSIAMDIGKKVNKRHLEERMLLFGIVTFAAGSLGQEPIRSQGHIHEISQHSGWSPPEIYEIWEGEAIIYMQETTNRYPGKCYAVHAGPGDIVVVPPKWAHATISSNPNVPLTFGALCDRQYGFEYESVRARQGLAWYPVFNENHQIIWEHNENYTYTKLIEKSPNTYESLNIIRGTSMYNQFENKPDNFQFVSKPYLKKVVWDTFIP